MSCLGRLKIVLTDLKKISGARKEVLPVLVEAESHDPVSEIEGFLDTVAVVYININVENSSIVTEQLIYSYKVTLIT